MLLLIQIDKLLPTEKDAESVKTILIYFLGLLLVLIYFGGKYLIKQNNQRFTDKDNIIDEKEKTITSLQSKLDEEQKYSKEQGNNFIKVATDNNHFLKNVNDSLEKVNVNLAQDISPIVNSNNREIIEVKKHIIKENG